MQNHLADMFSTMAGLGSPVSASPGRSGSGYSAPANDGRAKLQQNDFQGFLRAFASATRSSQADDAGQMPPVTRNKNHKAKLSRLTRHQRALGRIVGMATRGEIHARDLQDLPENEWERLETWALDGAGGAYPPLAPGAGEDISTQPEAESLAASNPTTTNDLPGVEPGAEDENDAIATLDSREALLALLADMQSGIGEADTMSSLESSLESSPEVMTGMGPEGVFPDKMPMGKDLALALISELLPESEAQTKAASPLLDGKRLFPEQMRGMFDELQDKIATMTATDLAAALRKALLAAGVVSDEPGVTVKEPSRSAGIDLNASSLLSGKADGEHVGIDADTEGGMRFNLDRMGELPLAILRSLAAKVLDAGVHGNQDADKSLLAALAGNAELKGRLLKMMNAGTGNDDSREIVGENNTTEILDADKTPKKNLDGAFMRRGPNHDRAGMMAAKPLAENRSMPGLVADNSGNLDLESASPGLSVVEALPGQVRVPGAELQGADQSSAAISPGLQAVTGVSRVDVLPPQVTSSQFMENLQRVEQVMRMSVKRGISQVSLQLSPAELGQVTLRLKMTAGVVSATIEADNPNAKHQLIGGLQQLRENLQVHGIELDSFDVFLAGGEAGEGRNERWPKLPHRSRKHDGDVDETADLLSAGEPIEAVRTGFSKEGSFDFVV